MVNFPQVNLQALWVSGHRAFSSPSAYCSLPPGLQLPGFTPLLVCHPITAQRLLGFCDSWFSASLPPLLLQEKGLLHQSVLNITSIFSNCNMEPRKIFTYGSC
jgi:hypothetical protein